MEVTQLTQQAPKDKKVVQKQGQQLASTTRRHPPDAKSLSGQLSMHHAGIFEMFVLASCIKQQQY